MLTVVIGLLILSNVFMMLAWYHHLRNPKQVFWRIFLISMLYVVVEYLLHIPANKIGYRDYSLYQLKILQECITIIVFIFFAYYMFNEKITLRYGCAMMLILLGTFVAFYGQESKIEVT